ncbi:hypothetical protein RCL_jg21912.t1 [Rhizophagus clarus]|uniref:Uncharacterized protein n=1 Tax=Rhizophagus clarus TaxID=94130 RepID=A0A8H3MGC4_9GLOM|nr:hypothetical protein RCL_jg21912.t1 [Rhizophagus clarus]
MLAEPNTLYPELPDININIVPSGYHQTFLFEFVTTFLQAYDIELTNVLEGFFGLPQDSQKSFFISAAADHAFRYHLLSSHPDFDSEDDTDTDINIDIMNEFHPVTPMPQQLSSLSQPLPIPDFTIIPSSDTTQMLTEDIPKIVTSFSKITSVPNGSRQFG